MKKILVLSVFLASSTLYVFSQSPPQALAMLGAPVDDDTGAAEARQSELEAQASALEATIAALENASSTVVATVASSVGRIASLALQPRQKNAAAVTAAVAPTIFPSTQTPTATPTPATTSVPAPIPTPSPISPFSLPQRYLRGDGALMEPNGTPVHAPAEAQRSANGLWYINEQAYAAPPVTGPGEELAPVRTTAHTSPAPTPTSVPAPIPTHTSVSVITTPPATDESVATTPLVPTPRPSTRRSRYSRDHDDDDD